MIFGSRDPYTFENPLDSDPAGEMRFEPVTLSHPHNPILAAFRSEHLELEFDAGLWLFALDQFDTFGGFVVWDVPSHPYHSITTATPGQIEHARRVLGRLGADS